MDNRPPHGQRLGGNLAPSPITPVSATRSTSGITPVVRSAAGLTPTVSITPVFRSGNQSALTPVAPPVSEIPPGSTSSVPTIPVGNPQATITDSNPGSAVRGSADISSRRPLSPRDATQIIANNVVIDRSNIPPIVMDPGLTQALASRQATAAPPEQGRQPSPRDIANMRPPSPPNPSQNTVNIRPPSPRDALPTIPIIAPREDSLSIRAASPSHEVNNAPDSPRLPRVLAEGQSNREGSPRVRLIEETSVNTAPATTVIAETPEHLVEREVSPPVRPIINDEPMITPSTVSSSNQTEIIGENSHETTTTMTDTHTEPSIPEPTEQEPTEQETTEVRVEQPSVIQQQPTVSVIPSVPSPSAIAAIISTPILSTTYQQVTPAPSIGPAVVPASSPMGPLVNSAGAQSTPASPTRMIPRPLSPRPGGPGVPMYIPNMYQPGSPVPSTRPPMQDYPQPVGQYPPGSHPQYPAGQYPQYPQYPPGQYPPGQYPQYPQYPPGQYPQYPPGYQPSYQQPSTPHQNPNPSPVPQPRPKKPKKKRRTEEPPPPPVNQKPDYAAMSPEEQGRARADFMTKFGILRSRFGTAGGGIYQIDLPDEDEDLDIIYGMYTRWVEQIYRDMNSNEYKVILMVTFIGLEIFGARVLGLKIGGFTFNQMTMLSRYDHLLIELGEKSYTKFGAGWPIEIRILLMVLFNAIVFMIVSYSADYFGPQVASLIHDGINCLLRGSQPNTTANGPIPLNNQSPSGVPPPPAPTTDFNINNLANMIGTVGGMFQRGGGNTGQAQNPSAAAPTPRPAASRRRPAFKE